MNYAPFSLLKVESALDKDTDWVLLKQAYDEYDLIRKYFYGNYYTLTEWTAKGADLMEHGITVTVPEQPYAVILLIKPAE